MRAAIYYAPQPGDPLWRAGCHWLGRDPSPGAPVPEANALADLTAAPRRYGFHATLKPPMRLNGDLADLLDAVERLAGRIPAFTLPSLRVAHIGGFLALLPDSPCPALNALADACVMELDHFRVLSTDADLARRRQAGLSERQDALLSRWGYPDVLDAWRFHMTLSRRLGEAEREQVQPLAEAWFADAIGRRRDVEDIAVFVEPEPGAPLSLVARRRLRA